MNWTWIDFNYTLLTNRTGLSMRMSLFAFIAFSLFLILTLIYLLKTLSSFCLKRFTGITNFDLLGDFGEIEWLGNFQIVLLYNIIFVGTTTLCLVNKFTATVRQELCNRLVENYVIFTNYVSFINWFALRIILSSIYCSDNVANKITHTHTVFFLFICCF